MSPSYSNPNNMVRTIFLLAGCLLFGRVMSQQPVLSYLPHIIPEALKKGADVVFRLDEASVDILSASEFTMTVHQVKTILNEKGGRHLNLGIGIDKFHQVKEVEVQVYDGLGQLVK